MSSRSKASPDVRCILGTPLSVTTYKGLTTWCQSQARHGEVMAIDFSNAHIVTMRRHNINFREATSLFDLFIPDGMPLVWCMNRLGAGLPDRIYGPTFMRECITASPAPISHYFLGGSADCLKRLEAYFLRRDPRVKIVGSHHGYFSLSEENGIVEEINRVSPDFVWIGLGTPKQQEWIHRNKDRVRRGLLLAVGFAFDVNAGLKADAPLWMQRAGLTWLHRLWSEPWRLAGRYLRYNSLFLLYLLLDGVRGRAFAAPGQTTAGDSTPSIPARRDADEG